MKICVFGAGAIGGYLAVGLKEAGFDVSIIARGPHLAAIQNNGLRLLKDEKEISVRLPASDNAADFPEQDFVILTLKSHSVPPIADKISPLLGRNTAIVTGMNGIPYWYFYGLDSEWGERAIKQVDPEGLLWQYLHPRRVIGCVVYPACEMQEPGVIKHIEGNRFTLGEPDGSRSERLQWLSQAMIKSGFKAPVKSNIRDEIWIKLWGNLSFNPISALTRSTLDDIVSDNESRQVARAMMLEAESIATRLGIKFRIDVDRRIEAAGRVGAHRTSMLQDIELGRPVEIDALLGAVKELGELTGVKTPTIDTVLALTRRLGKALGCYSA